MTWTLDASTPGTYQATNPNTVSHTCAASADLLVAVIFVNGNTARTGGAPTYNGTTMTDSGEGFVVHTECGVELWYLINPDTGSSYTVSVPNSGAINFDISVMSFIPSEGSNALDNANSGTAVSQNPSINVVTGNDNALMVSGLGSGERDVPTAGANYSLVHTYDAGNQTWGSEYDLDAGTAGTIAVDYGTARSDDWGLIGIAFYEVTADPAPNVSDDATVTDSLTITVSAPQPGITDNATVTDSVTASITGGADPEPSVQDDATVTDSTSVTVSDPQITAQDDATVTDSATASVPALSVNISDDLTVASYLWFYESYVTATDSATVAVEAEPALSVNVSDDITVTDSAAADVSDPQVSVQSDATVTDSASADVSDPQVAVQSDATVTDSVTVALGAAGETEASASDDVTVTDSVSLTVSAPQVTAQSDATVTDSVSLSVPDAGAVVISVQDDITVTDSVAITVSDPAISIVDNATVTDSYTVSVQDVTPVSIGVQDDLTITDSVSITPLVIDLNIADNVTLTDSITAAIPGYIVTVDPDNVAYVRFKERRAYAEYKERRSFVRYREKRSVV
jgi:epidermal growth factor receptor substrate 15